MFLLMLMKPWFTNIFLFFNAYIYACAYAYMPWKTRTHCCGHIVAHDVSWAAQTGGKHLLRTQNVSEQNQKHFLCPGHKICVRNKCCARGQTGKHLCRQQCVRNNVSATMCPPLPGPLWQVGGITLVFRTHQ